MGLGYFNNIFYPDELLYSLLARNFFQGAYTSYRYASEDFFVNPKIRVEKEFIKNLKPEIVSLLTKNMSVEELLEKHTMYPFYGRFLDAGRRKDALESLTRMEGDFSKMFGVPNTREKRFLKYCHLCAREDREKFGETYWHRVHQIGNNVCVKHKCYLRDSGVMCGSYAPIGLFPAEEDIIDSGEILYCNQQVEIELAQYMKNVFRASILSETSDLKKFLRHKLVGTPYTSARGEHCYFHRMWCDVQKHYSSLPDICTLKERHIQAILGGRHKSFRDICMVAMFLQIPPDELARMEAPKLTPEELFDMRVGEMLGKGMSYNNIAKELNAPGNVVRMSARIIGSPKVKYVHNQKVPDKINYPEMDDQMLVSVQGVLQKFIGVTGEKPRRVSFYSVAKEIKFPVHRLYKMQKCAEEIRKHQESDEYYFARKLKWGWETLERKGEPIKYWTLCRVCKMEKVQLDLYTPYMRELGWPEIADRVDEIMRYRKESQ